MSATAVQRQTWNEQYQGYLVPRPNPVQDLDPQPMHKRPACSLAFRQQNNLVGVAQVTPTIRSTAGLDDSYVIEDRLAVSHFIDEHHLFGLLLQAKQHLDVAFTDRPVKTLSLVRDDEGFETLFCLVMIAGDMQPARQALRRFDQEWWLARSGQVAGKLNFDFELI